MKFRINPRTGTPELVPEEIPSNEDILQKVKRVFYRRIRHYNISEDEIIQMIEKVHNGTRNVHYLVNRENSDRLRDIAYFILRETI